MSDQPGCPCSICEDDDGSLRDRIAKVLAVESVRQGQDCDWAVLADAVIAALDEDYDPYEAKADAERQQWADDEGIPR